MNALDKYYGTISRFTDFNPAPLDDRSARIMEVLEQRNDPTAWLAYAGTSMKQAWMAIPTQQRQEMLNSLTTMIDAALANGSDALETLQDVTNSISNVPLIGWIIGAILQVVGDAATLVNLTKSTRKKERSRWKRHAMYDTIEGINDPKDWVFKSVRVKNYSYYVGSRPGGNYSREACFSRGGGDTNRMLRSTNGPSNKGRCGHKKGVEQNCGRSGAYGDGACEASGTKKSNPRDYCKVYLGFSALFYPYWSTAYPAEPMGVPINEAERPEEVQNPNALLIVRQTALLTDPYANLRVDGTDVKRMLDTWVEKWSAFMTQMGAWNGTTALIPINEDGEALNSTREERLTVDADYDPNQAQGGAKARNQFYFDDVGRIIPYGSAKLSEWGIRATGGKGYGRNGGWLGCTVGAYNAVVTNALAFFTVRANMLRNGIQMRGLLVDHKLNTLDYEVRAAAQYASNQGRMLPGPSRKIPGRGQKKVILRGVRVPGGGVGSTGSGGGAGVALVGAGAVIALLAFLRR